MINYTASDNTHVNIAVKNPELPGAIDYESQFENMVLRDPGSITVQPTIWDKVLGGSPIEATGGLGMLEAFGAPVTKGPSLLSMVKDLPKRISGTYGEGKSLLKSLLRKDKKLTSQLGPQLSSEVTTKLPNVSLHQSQINNKNLAEPLITGRDLLNRAKNMNVEDMSIFNNQFNDVSKYKKVYGAYWEHYLNNDKRLIQDIIANKRKMSKYADALYESGGPGWTGGNVGLPMSYGPSYTWNITSPTGSNIVGQKTLLDYVGFDSDIGKEILKKAYTR